MIADMNDLNAKLKRNNKNWIIAEKCISIILLLWGIFIFYSMVLTIAGIFNSGYFATGKVTFGAVAAEHHLNVIISVFCIFGSSMLLFRDRTGWIFCVISSFMFGVSLFMSSRARAVDDALSFAKYYKSYGAVALIFFIIFFLLISKQVHKKYKPTSKTWLWIASIILLLVIDKLVF